MTQNEQKTGPYTHAPGMQHEVRFPTAGRVERSFTIVFATGYLNRPADTNAAGIAILDNDNGRVVTDGIRPLRGFVDEDGPAAMIALQAFAGMRWDAFSKACRESSRYRGGIEDIDQAADMPHSGNPDLQISMGLIEKQPDDPRTTLMREVHASAFIPYDFPARTRAEMETEILSRAKSRGSEIAPEWAVLPDGQWNRTGRIRGGELIDPGFDHDWTTHVTRNPSVLVEAARRFASSYPAFPK